MLKGKAIKIGDTIGLIAPSSPTSPERVDLAKEALENMGFKVKMGKTCYERYGYLAGNDKLRAEDLNRMFQDEEVDGIICLRGGYGAAKMLPYINYECIGKNPKVFVGYSDITAIHGVLNKICNLLTIHGPMVSSDMIDDFDEFSRVSLFNMIMKNEIKGFLENPEGEEIKCLVPGRAKGQIVGGNLALITSLIGTPYEIDTRDKILFIEDVDEEPYRVDRMLTQLLLSGKLKEVSGIILGDFSNSEPKNPDESLTLIQVFNDIIKPLGKPTIYNFKAGHCSVKATLPLGAMACIDGEGCTIEIKESAVL